MRVVTRAATLCALLGVAHAQESPAHQASVPSAPSTASLDAEVSHESLSAGTEAPPSPPALASPDPAAPRFDVLETLPLGASLGKVDGGPVLLPRLRTPPLALEDGSFGGSLSEPPPAARAAPPAPPPVDDRSAWAKWNSSLAGVTTSIVGFDIFCVGMFTLLPNDVTGWQDPEFKGLKENFTVGPRVDNDNWYWNYIAHPVTGAEYYLIARNREYSWYASAAYSFGMSTFWEGFIESSYEQASWQDIFITPVAGTVLGELRWQAKQALVNPSTGRPVGALNKTLYVLLDPFDALTKL